MPDTLNNETPPRTKCDKGDKVATGQKSDPDSPTPLALRAVLFDLYNTLIHIRTTEHDPLVWEQLARFLRYRGIPAQATALQEQYFAHLHYTHEVSRERHPEIDAVGTFRHLLAGLGWQGGEEFLVEVTQLFRVLSIREFRIFDDALATLRGLRARGVRLGVVSDAQPAFLEPEIRDTGLHEFFDTVVISGAYGYRKPDPRLFQFALDRLGVRPGEAAFVGDNRKRDVGGARAAGLAAIWIPRPISSCDPALPTPHYTLGSLAELLDLVNNPVAV